MVSLHSLIFMVDLAIFSIHESKDVILKPEKLQFTAYLEFLFKEKRLQPICTGCYGNNKGIYVG